ncbi:MAG: hypothetical protein QOE08_634, partial [Thermoleophilaceae bacterium]|nr:hypothetical protein [Thermoleophilaceae bacterium]
MIARHPGLYDDGWRGRLTVRRMWLRWAIESALS